MRLLKTHPVMFNPDTFEPEQALTISFRLEKIQDLSVLSSDEAATIMGKELLEIINKNLQRR